MTFNATQGHKVTGNTAIRYDIPRVLTYLLSAPARQTQTDRQTDRQTDGTTISIAERDMTCVVCGE